MSALDWDHNAYYHRLLLRHLPRPRHRVLDAGCGAGAFATLRASGRGSWYGKQHSRRIMPVVLDPPLTTRQVRRQASAILSGAHVRRLVFWHYFLLWQKPVTA